MIPLLLVILGLLKPMNLSLGLISGPRCSNISRTISLVVTLASAIRAQITSPMGCSTHSLFQTSHGLQSMLTSSHSCHYLKDSLPFAFFLIISPRWHTLLQLLTDNVDAEGTVVLFLKHVFSLHGLHDDVGL